jgi:hypothetical protein
LEVGKGEEEAEDEYEYEDEYENSKRGNSREGRSPKALIGATASCC